MPGLSKLDWRAAGAPDPNNGFSVPRLTSSGLVSTHVQTNSRPVSHLCVKLGIIMSDLICLGVSSTPSDISLLENWYPPYPPWLWLLCVSARRRPAGPCAARSCVGIGSPCLHCPANVPACPHQPCAAVGNPCIMLQVVCKFRVGHVARMYQECSIFITLD